MSANETNTTNLAATASLRSTGVALIVLGAPFALIGAWLCDTSFSVDAIVVLLCGVAIAAFGLLQVVRPGALLGEAAEHVRKYYRGNPEDGAARTMMGAA